MSSFLRKVRRRKKSRMADEVQVVEREQYEQLELDAKISLIVKLVPLGLMHIAELLNEEVESLAGARYERKGDEARGARYGFNKGSVRLAGQRVPIKVPRVRGARGELPLRSYAVSGHLPTPSHASADQVETQRAPSVGAAAFPDLGGSWHGGIEERRGPPQP